MIKMIISFTRWLKISLDKILSWLEGKGQSAEVQSKFVDLAPTDGADKTGIYSEAILFAINNTKVHNIALTGPYGSGKSSIIQSFLKRYRRSALHISLAAFIPEPDAQIEKVGRQEIERSILQQMLYGADANKLPFSRFKRIKSPSTCLSIFKSFWIMLGGLALWYLLNNRDGVINGDFFHPLAVSNWFNLVTFLIATLFLWGVLYHFYTVSFGLSLKSLSLKDVEIRPALDDQTSILNRHLDEIIYFFQATNYDLVIIEDLDRFNNADIFVTMREINKLVNENAGVNRSVRFLYALRDDMFVNTDRTKFFEFIIPVIPIINSSNSIDMILEQGRRLELDKRLDRQFLREVSRYLNDLRLIQNIFNEYAIYISNLETDGEVVLNASKLLAILIYKNVYPSDFEQLHRGEGNLAEILSHKDELIIKGEATYKAEITELEEQLELFERQIPLDLKELRQIYAMALIEKIPANAVSVSFDQSKWIPLSQLAIDDEFEEVIAHTNIYHRNVYGQVNSVDISTLHSELDAQRSYQKRKKMLEGNAADNKKKSLLQLRSLKEKIVALRTTKLNELLRLNTDIVQEVFEKFEENAELARYLILEGYLDDTYYQYTSLFHSGRLSPHDNKFLIQIRAFVTPEPGFQIDNPHEVIAAMREEDFRQSYILNVTLVDSLLTDQSRYPSQTENLLEFLSSNFEHCEDFLNIYYSSGHEVAKLLSGLASTWEGLVSTAIASSNNISHVTKLVANLPESSLKNLARDNEELPEFVSTNLPEILVNAPELSPERLACLEFEVKDLAAIKEYSEIVRFMFEKELFELTIANIEYVYQAILGENDLEPLRERNYTTIRSTKSNSLIKRVEREFDNYFNDVLLSLEGNVKEHASAILAVLCHDTLGLEDVRVFLERQTTQLPSLEDVPENFHAMLFQLGKIEPSWLNCLSFIEGNVFEADILIEYLERKQVRKVVLQQTILGDSVTQKLRQFLVKAGSLSDEAYRDYTQALPNAFKKLPEGLEPAKLRILIDERKIVFNEENFYELADHMELQVLFVATNIKKYLANTNDFSLGDDFLEEILRSKIDDHSKLGIVELMELHSLPSFPQRSALIGQIINDTNANIDNIDGDIAKSLVINSEHLETQISLFNKYHSLMTNNDVREVLTSLPKPFSEIKTGYTVPRLKNNTQNIELVNWLESRNIISSWSESGLFSNEIRVNLFRR